MTPLLSPPAAVTVTAAVPDRAGATAVISVSDTTVNEVAGVEPKCTEVASVNPVPAKRTVLPPASGPASEVSGASAGAGR